MLFDTKVAGIPCLCKVTHHNKVKPWRGSPQSCPSSDDYYGYEDFEFEIKDRKGYSAAWLEKKLKPEDKDRLLEEFHLELTGERYGYLNQ